MKKTNLVLIIMLACAAVAVGFGFLVMSQRTSRLPSEDQTQNNNQQQQEEQKPVEEETQTVSTTGWKVYVNDKHGFNIQYPTTLKAGSISDNSVLGTFQVPIRGYHVGPLVFVILKDAEIKKDAQELFNNVYNAAVNPPSGEGAEVPPVECKIDKVTNTNVVSLKAVSCNGEGGPAKYAYIQGAAYDIFVDGYSKGYDQQNNGEIPNIADYVTILSTFKFGTEVATPTSNTNSSTSFENRISQAPETTPNPQPIIQTFTINANDNAANPSEINVTKDAIVQITFNVTTENSYYGGMDFKSSVVNSGTIQSGSSKTISFKATQSFEFIPYWPASNVAKNYRIKVNVQ